ncbi:MAG: phosphatase PAP2 family protein [Acidimicrobiia bacterium]|nr:phosphatase PAP2 family protein [Acidimicrobiia bacterium]
MTRGPGAGGEHPLADTAVEALGGTPASVERPPASPVRGVLPPGLSRRVASFDRAAERLFDQHLRDRTVPDRVAFLASSAGDFSLVWHAAGALSALRGPHHRRAWRRLAIALAIESLVVNWGIKSLFRRTRPVWDQPRRFRLRQPRTSSFPSGHATSGFLAATLLADADARSPLASAWFVLAAVVAGSRVHVRIHHASDVVAGAGMGLLAGRLVRRRWPLGTPGAVRRRIS